MMNSPVQNMRTFAANQAQFMPGPGVQGHMPNSQVLLPSNQMLNNMPHNPMALMPQQQLQQQQQQQRQMSPSHSFAEQQSFRNSGSLPVLQTQAGVPVQGQGQVQAQMQMQMMHSMPHHVGWQAPGLLPGAGCASNVPGHMLPCHEKFSEAPTEVQPQPARPSFSQEGMSRERSRSRTRQNGGESKPMSAQTGGEHV